ncbi:MAG: lipocalin-like domain-containing protein [Paracoccaceae bacterium]
MTKTTPLTGTWALISWHNTHGDGHKTYPLGPDATGYISYSADGFVFVHLMAANRTLYSVNDPFNGNAAEDSAAIKSQITYAGPYDFHGDHVIHNVTQSSCPNWVGTQQHRMVRFEGDSLILSAAGARFQGQDVTAQVHWKRASR